MSAHDSLGEFEQSVLLAIAHLGDGAYGVPIRQEIERRTGRTVAVGALYTALERLGRKGYLRSEMSKPLPERGGRSRRHYWLRPAGAEALQRSRELLNNMWRGLRLELRTGRKGGG
jgi:PadR family transcriptional regulator PadR